MGESRDSLREAIGRLDAAALTPAGTGPGAKARSLSMLLSGRWIIVLVLMAAAAAAVASLLAA